MVVVATTTGSWHNYISPCHISSASSQFHGNDWNWWRWHEVGPDCPRRITFSHWGTLQLLLPQTLVYPSRLFDTQPGQKWFCLKLQLGGGKIENCTKAIIIAKMDGVKRTMSSFAFLQCITKENPLVLEHSENSATFNKKNWKYDNKGCIGGAKITIC